MQKRPLPESESEEKKKTKPKPNDDDDEEREVYIFHYMDGGATDKFRVPASRADADAVRWFQDHRDRCSEDEDLGKSDFDLAMAHAQKLMSGEWSCAPRTAPLRPGDRVVDLLYFTLVE